jgi:hypothetical protein
MAARRAWTGFILLAAVAAATTAAAQTKPIADKATASKPAAAPEKKWDLRACLEAASLHPDDLAVTDKVAWTKKFGTRTVYSLDSEALKETPLANIEELSLGKLYVPAEGVLTLTPPNDKCALFFRLLHREKDVAKVFKLRVDFSERVQDTDRERTDRSEAPRERRTCIETDPDAAEIEKSLTNAMCQDGRFVELCGLLSTMHLCEYSLNRAAIRTAVAGLLATDLAADIQAPVTNKIARVVRLLEHSDRESLNQAADELIAAVKQDALGVGSEPSKLSQREVALAAAITCRLEDSARDAADRSPSCPSNVAWGLGNPEAAPLAEHLFAAISRRRVGRTAARERFRHALEAARLAAKEAKSWQWQAIENLCRVIVATEAGDADAVFAMAATLFGKPKDAKDEKKRTALGALAFALTRSLTVDRLYDRKMIEEEKESVWDIRPGISVRALAALELGPQHRFVGPLSVPVGLSIQNRKNPGAFFEVSFLDPGQYVTLETRGQGDSEHVDARRARPLDILTLAGAVGVRHGGSWGSFVMAATTGAARIGTGDVAGFAGVTLGLAVMPTLSSFH